MCDVLLYPVIIYAIWFRCILLQVAVHRVSVSRAVTLPPANVTRRGGARSSPGRPGGEVLDDDDVVMLC